MARKVRHDAEAELWKFFSDQAGHLGLHGCSFETSGVRVAPHDRDSPAQVNHCMVKSDTKADQILKIGARLEIIGPERYQTLAAFFTPHRTNFAEERRQTYDPKPKGDAEALRAWDGPTDDPLRGLLTPGEVALGSMFRLVTLRLGKGATATIADWLALAETRGKASPGATKAEKQRAREEAERQRSIGKAHIKGAIAAAEKQLDEAVAAYERLMVSQRKAKTFGQWLQQQMTPRPSRERAERLIHGS